MLEALASIVESEEGRDPRGGRFFAAIGLGGAEVSANAKAIERLEQKADVKAEVLERIATDVAVIKTKLEHIEHKVMKAK
jgi:hypothetical protein